MKYDEVKSLVTLAGIDHMGFDQVENQYWPNTEHYQEIRDANPWWVVRLAEGGKIVMGWRKRVISIDWVETPRRGIVTEDDVTKGDDHVHAWSIQKALEYLTAWRSLPVTERIIPGCKISQIEGRERVIEALRVLGDDSLELNLLKGLLDEVQDESLPSASITRVANHHGFNVRVGGLNINYYPKV